MATLIRRFFYLSHHTHPASLLLHQFAHGDIMHIAFNMLALYSFSSMLFKSLGVDYFVLIYAASGLVGGLASLAGKARARLYAVPSVGASGAVYGVVVATVLMAPQMKLMFIFLPFVSFPAYAMLPALLSLDVVGYLRRWRRFDHAGHLGGALTGTHEKRESFVGEV